MTAFLSSSNYLSITALNSLLNETLEQCFPELIFIGEVSEIKVASSGHGYLTLKDDASSIPIILWRTTLTRVDFKLEVGSKLVCYGKPSIYPRTGRLQIIVHKIELEGAGDLQAKFIKLKNKLESEGLFDISRKRKLPFLPKVIGVVSSAGGAAIQDFLVRITARMPSTKVLLYDSLVQGTEAVRQITAGIKVLNQDPDVEVIVLARGGGSLEDLWCFNEEAVAREIFASRKPIVSAVGHETDYTIADLVADLRAPTPTAAAEMLVPDRVELLKQLDFYQHRLGSFQNFILNSVQRIDDLELSLNKRISEYLNFYINSLKQSQIKIKLLRPINFASIINHLGILENRLENAIKLKLQFLRQELNLLEQRNLFLNPRTILSLGYAAVSQNSKRVMLASDVQPNIKLKLEFLDQSIFVEKIEDDK